MPWELKQSVKAPSKVHILFFFNHVGEDSWESLGLQGDPTSHS